jgi:hypothetical protein
VSKRQQKQHHRPARHTLARAFFEDGNIVGKWWTTMILAIFFLLWLGIKAQENLRYWFAFVALWLVEGIIISPRFRCPYCRQPKRNTKYGFFALWGPPGGRCAKCRSLL